jgi:hypothetical protein
VMSIGSGMGRIVPDPADPPADVSFAISSRITTNARSPLACAGC